MHNILIDNSVVMEDLDDIIAYDELDELVVNEETIGEVGDNLLREGRRIRNAYVNSL